MENFLVCYLLHDYIGIFEAYMHADICKGFSVWLLEVKYIHIIDTYYVCFTT